MDRRDFIRLSTAAATSFGLSGLTTLLPKTVRAGLSDLTFAAEGVFKHMVDGSSIFTWRFRDLNGSGPGDLGSGLVVVEGDVVDITVHNDLDRAINLEIPKVLEGAPQVPPGGSHAYSFTAPEAGTYMYFDSDEIGRAMGLAGPLIVIPSDGSNRLYVDGPIFDRQYTLVLQELDDRLNRAIFAGGTYDMAKYEPNYFFVNGLSYPLTAGDTDTLVDMNLGERVALRFVNAGLIANPMHFHGYHVDVAARDRIPETAVITKDTVLVNIGECVDVVLRCDQPGTYPLHTHYIPGVTANGVYANPYGGALVVMSAS